MADGIRRRHSARCSLRAGRRCDCGAGWEASVFSARDGKKIRRSFPTRAAAKAWRAEALAGLRRGTIRPPTPTTVRQAADALISGMRAGVVRNRSGDLYKPSAIRSYADALRLHVLPRLGARKLADVHRRDVQRLADELLAAGRDPSTIRNALIPLRVIYRQAFADGDVGMNPCSGVRLPAVRGRRQRIVSAREAGDLLRVLTDEDAVLWALALYGGLRRGELMALRWVDVDLPAGVLRVERAWDPKSRIFVEPKSRAGRRVVPMANVLREALLTRKDRARSELVVPGPNGAPFDPGATTARASRAWRAAGLTPITLHEARHTFASLMIASGVNAKALTTYMGHASVTITYDRYGHLMPGNEREAATLLDAYLRSATE
jgi:integrase